MRISLKSALFTLSASFPPRAVNVALANGLLGVLGTQNAEMVEMTKFSGIYQISLNLAKFS